MEKRLSVAEAAEFYGVSVNNIFAELTKRKFYCNDRSVGRGSWKQERATARELGITSMKKVGRGKIKASRYVKVTHQAMAFMDFAEFAE